ncbi:hypothetical protein JM658_16210 [Joostella atrarenae]|uniref:Uncharacterized protein n=1 Tax=Joostella atrarenae TaxID=679257 RepID=A0ABS9J7J2_9FLAO|nr:hypothetical protein [Joostella atrarenae]MCF8716375.1 hypothetical protein [Joostella atrarenae]
MVKIYFDWNVLSQIKNGSHSELKEIIFDNEKLFIPFSTSHVGDIFSSFKETDTQRDYIESDLNFISELTKDKCLMNTGKDVVLDFYPPQKLFEQRIEEKDLFSDISLDGLMNIFEQDDFTKSIGKSLINLIKSIPIEESFKQAFENPESAEQMNKMFPGLKENPTMEGFFKSFSKMNLNLNESDGYQELRKTVQGGMGINRDRIFASNAPYKIIDEKYKEIGTTPNQFIDNSKNAPEWFNEITNEYLLLDMHGYQEDKVNIKKGRKETFKNTTEDAFHSAFASTCNFYVINDNKSYKKTKMVYEKLGINTLVLKPSEFVEYYQKYLDIKDIILNFRIPFEVIKMAEFYEEKMETGILRTYYVPFFFFGFFNKIMVLIPNDDSETLMLLSQNGPSNHRVYSMEIQHLYKQLYELLGEDIENLGQIKDEEFKEDEWIGRKWKSNEITFRLTRPNGHFQLYFDQ